MTATVLFVCSGNICRSPMAERIARVRVAAALGVTAQELPLDFASAGTFARIGLPATGQSMLAAGEVGVDLSGHWSRPVDEEMVRRADRVYGLTRGHVRDVVALAPGSAEKVELLDADGADIEDPYGADLQAYRTVRDRIATAVEARLGEWVELARRFRG
ncbi:MAG: low molecular weight protein arginine phosphatase [Acidimicrobiia bacterium]